MTRANGRKQARLLIEALGAERIKKLNSLPGYTELKMELTPIKSAAVSAWVRAGAKCRAYECDCTGRRAAFVINIAHDFPDLICKAGAEKLVAEGKAQYVAVVEGADLKKIIAKNKLSTTAKYEAYRATHPELSLPTHHHVAEAHTEAKGWDFAIKNDAEGYPVVCLPNEVRR